MHIACSTCKHCTQSFWLWQMAEAMNRQLVKEVAEVREKAPKVRSRAHGIYPALGERTAHTGTSRRARRCTPAIEAAECRGVQVAKENMFYEHQDRSRALREERAQAWARKVSHRDARKEPQLDTRMVWG